MHLLIALDNSLLNERITEFLKKYFAQLKEVPLLSFIYVIARRFFNTVSGYPEITMSYDVLGQSFENYDAIINQIKIEAGSIIGGLQRELGVKGTIAFPLDDPLDAVLEACHEKQPDLLIVGTHSRKGINHF